MTQEEKDLLLKDLCARLPYNVKAYVKNWSKLDKKYYEDIYDVKSVFPSLNEVHVQSKTGSVNVLWHPDYDIKPYLFPLSSMTEEQKNKLQNKLIELELKAINDEINHTKMAEYEIDFYNQNHIDFRGLIEKGLAIEAPEGMYKFNK